MRALLIAITLASPAAADWRPVEDVAGLLTGARIDYMGVGQLFMANGTTYYGPDFGLWAVRDGRYCSVWPPETSWICYGVERDDDRIRFIGPDGAVTEGRLVP